MYIHNTCVCVCVCRNVSYTIFLLNLSFFWGYICFLQEVACCWNDSWKNFNLWLHTLPLSFFLLLERKLSLVVLSFPLCRLAIWLWQCSFTLAIILLLLSRSLFLWVIVSFPLYLSAYKTHIVLAYNQYKDEHAKENCTRYESFFSFAVAWLVSMFKCFMCRPIHHMHVGSTINDLSPNSNFTTPFVHSSYPFSRNCCLNFLFIYLCIFFFS